MSLLLDVQHPYTGHWTDGAICRIRVYAATARSGGLPVVLCTELPANTNTSITNRAEYLAADVLRRYLPHLDGADPPFVWIEHYPDDCPSWRHRVGGHDDLGRERFSLVTFAHTNPRREVGWQLRETWKFGTPAWQSLELAAVEELLGQTWRTEHAADYPPALTAWAAEP